MLAIQRLLDRFVDGVGAGKLNRHPHPRDRLQQGPMAAHREDEGKHHGKLAEPL